MLLLSLRTRGTLPGAEARFYLVSYLPGGVLVSTRQSHCFMLMRLQRSTAAGLDWSLLDQEDRVSDTSAAVVMTMSDGDHSVKCHGHGHHRA